MMSLIKPYRLLIISTLKFNIRLPYKYIHQNQSKKRGKKNTIQVQFNDSRAVVVRGEGGEATQSGKIEVKTERNFFTKKKKIGLYIERRIVIRKL